MPTTKRPPADASGFPPKMGAPARRALENAGYTRLEELTGLSEAELLKLHGMGPKAMAMLRDALAAKGLSLRT
jgi:DNA-directed RNA polymerase alpha subunit